MPLGVADKKYFGMAKGINTEAPLTQWPDGYTVDEQNFDLLSDGSRRRRPCIWAERGAIGTFPDLGASVLKDESDAFHGEIWNTVNNNATINFYVLQMGYELHIFRRPLADQSLHSQYTGKILDLRNFRVGIPDLAYEATDDDIRTWPVDLTFGQGKMFVVGKHTEPFWVEYDEATDAFAAEAIVIQERDFVGIEDGIPTSEQPATLSDTHKYNLHNRGWTPANYTAYFNAKGKYPSKAQIQWRGMQRQDPSGAWIPDDGIKQFSPDKLFNELFQDSSSPQGHMRLNTFDTRKGFDPSGIVSANTFTGCTARTAVAGEYYDVTLTSTGHGLSVGATIQVVNLVLKWHNSNGYSTNSHNGPFVVQSVPDANHIVLRVHRGGSGWDVPEVKSGSWSVVSEQLYITKSTDPKDALKYRFTCTQFYAGRVWYAGALDTKLGNKVYFSIISEDPKKAGKCYQEADPTSEFISELVPTDGGVIVIPEMQDVLGLTPYGHNLIVYARNGVWAIGPGELGIFSPTSYSVRKVTDSGAISREAIIVAENLPAYWAADGIYFIQEDQNSGFLVAQNVTRDVINGLYMNIPIEDRQRANAVYDFYRKRIMWFYNAGHPMATADPPLTGEDMPTTSPVTPIVDPADAVDMPGYTHALLYDLRLGAWTKWAFQTAASTGGNVVSVREIVAFENDYTINHETRVKLISRYHATNRVFISEFRVDVDIFLDWGHFPGFDAFIATGPDSLGEPAKFKYAPIVTVFFRRLENSKCQIQGRWDWSRGSNSGKMTNFFNAYRETRPDPNAFSMTVTKNKLPGRGRNLFLMFRAEGDNNPMWLDGYTINYEALMKE